MGLPSKDKNGRPLPGKPGAPPPRGLAARGPPPPPFRKKGLPAVNLDARRRARLHRRSDRREEEKSRAGLAEDIFEVEPEGMTVVRLAEMLAVSAAEVVLQLYQKGVKAVITSVLDTDAVRLVAEEYGVDVLDKAAADVTEAARKSTTPGSNGDSGAAGTSAYPLLPRPPVVTVMGHVDHGKTTLLDALRRSSVAAGEAGGITQAIGAYTCSLDNLACGSAGGGGDEVDGINGAVDMSGADADDDSDNDLDDTSAALVRAVTFLDTPGHEAFGAMRARGARATDIVVLVVAADEGVRPQTVEALAHARAAGVPVVAALSKCDRAEADPERVRGELAAHDCVPEAWGGTVPVVETSARTGAGLTELVESLLLVAELEEPRARTAGPARGIVLDGAVDPRRGTVASLLVQEGTLRVGDAVSAGAAHGRVRAMSGADGQSLDTAGPSTAVQITGLGSVPVAGDGFAVHADEPAARAAAETAAQKLRERRLDELAASGGTVHAAVDSGEHSHSPGGSRGAGASTDESPSTAMHPSLARLVAERGLHASSSPGAGTQTLAGLLARPASQHALPHPHPTTMLNLVVKTDSSGAAEAARSALQNLAQGCTGNGGTSTGLRLLLVAPGRVTASDIDLAHAAGGAVLGFQTRVDSGAAAAAVRYRVPVSTHAVIYDMLDAVRNALESTAARGPEVVTAGEAIVKAVFGSGRRRAAGCVVTEGVLHRGGAVRVWRGEKLLFQGDLESLRREKEDVSSVPAGTECGVALPDFADWQEGDRLEELRLASDDA